MPHSAMVWKSLHFVKLYSLYYKNKSSVCNDVVFLFLQNDNDLMEAEFELTSIARLGKKADPSHFELLKVLGQGSFGRVSIYLVIRGFCVD